MHARPSSTGIVSIIVAVIVVCLGCTSQPGAAVTVSPMAEAASPIVASASPESPSPAPAATTLPAATGEPSTGPAPSPADSPMAEPSMAEPPAARLAVEGGDPVVGELGSFTWKDAGSDAPWLPGHPIHVSAAEHLTFTLASAVPIETWQVARVLPSAVPGGDGAIGMADGTGNVIGFEAPPAGRWSVTVRVRFGGNLGDAAYYWAVTVD